MTNDYEWTIEELKSLYNSSLIELVSKANRIHTEHHTPGEVQVSSLISVKTGGCPEDCKYCAQSSRYSTEVLPQPIMPLEEVLSTAKKAIANGATRICLGAAWREVKEGKQFDEILKMVKAITGLGVEVCTTLGMINDQQAIKLKEAGLYAYSHNLDSSEKFYKTIITTRTYQDRLNTLEIIRRNGLTVCCGAILGLGEDSLDRLEFLLTLSRLKPHPESVPLNRLSPVPGTPLEKQPPLSPWESVRMVALARIVLPKSMIRLSAGRMQLSFQEQALCFIAGANSIHAGEKLLTVANQTGSRDEEMFQLLGLKKQPPFKKGDYDHA